MYKALIIDDEKPVRTVITALGQWKKYHIEQPATAENGKDGLSAMRELRPHIVFVDMQMPIMNGIEFLKLASKEFPKTRFIIVSGFDEFQYAQSAIKYGAIDYLLKPIVETELNSALERAIEQLSQSEPVTQEKTPSVSPEEVITIIRDYVEKNYCQDIKVTMFSEQYFFSKEYLSKLFKKKYGFGIYEYALKLRMERAKELLANPDLKITEISDRLGYKDNHYFSKAFKNYFHLSPSEFREGISKDLLI